MSNSAEEKIARDQICFGNSDAILIITDGTCLERSLNLVYQITEITNNVIVCVNLLDEAKKKGIEIDLTELERILGVPVVGTIAKKKKTLEKLMKKVELVCSKKVIPNPRRIIYQPIIEESVEILDEKLVKLCKDNEKIKRWVALKIIDGNRLILKDIEDNLKIKIVNNLEIDEEKKRIRKIFDNKGIKTENVKDMMISSIIFMSENVYNDVVKLKDSKYNEKDRKIDKILTSKKFGIPIMIFFLGVILWITIIGANYPSNLLSDFFEWIQDKIIYLFSIWNMPEWFQSLLVDGVYKTVTWIIAVMLPPMAIFFPLFTILEDLGFLPRLAFNLDKMFKKAGTSGKQALPMCMGFGCNSVGVTGCRIIDSPRERLIAILTNAFVPCNGRFPFLITVSSIFIGRLVSEKYSSLIATITVLLIIIFGIGMTILVSKILSKTILKGESSSFILELTQYRKPQIFKVIIRSILDRTLFVLGRAICVAIPAGILIWLLANISIGNISILNHIGRFLDPFAKIMGLDGYILAAFILGLPANEIVLPIILMCYLGSGSLVDMENTFNIGNILIENGWTLLTAINVLIFTILHFPCATTLLTIKKETGSIKWMMGSFLLPTICGILLCMSTNLVWNIFIV